MYLNNCCITELADKPGLVQIDGVCPNCKEPWSLTLVKDLVIRYMTTKEKVQKIFPQLTSSNRELLVSGICDSCWECITGCE